jgi:DNA-binding NtrC family response regulator
MPRVLVVDDEAAVRESLRMLLKKESEVETAEDVDSALAMIEASPPDLVLLDVVMPGRSGLDLLPELASRGLRIPVIVLTATNTIAVAVQAMKAGAADFLTKPFELDALRIKVRQLLDHRALELEVERLRDEVEERQQLGDMVGRSAAMREIFRAVERVAKSQASVLITGQSGTGKELVARAVHQLSPRVDAPFVAVNCGAIPHDLIESELFGHERGAFTGATDRRIGRFEAAAGGTLFLDEIGELDRSVQVKLLRALQERVIERVGSSSSIAVDVRVVAATNRDLEWEIENGRFREDLYYRINVVPVHLPALVERREDILLLADTFLARIAKRDAKGGEGVVRKLSTAARAALEGYVWPGNVRELQNAIEHGLALSEGDVIELDHLPLVIRNTGSAEALREDWRHGRVSFEDAVVRFETDMLREALERVSWNQTHAASGLGLTRRVLKLKIDRFGIKPPS